MLWELGRKAGDVARRDEGFESVRHKLVGAIKVLGRGAPTVRGLLKFLFFSITPAAIPDGCSPRLASSKPGK